MAENPYAPPKAEIADPARSGPAKPSALVRFSLTTVCALVAYLLLIVPRIDGDLRNPLIGAVALSVIAGVIALTIPVRSKWLFVLPSVFASFTIAYLLGRG